MKAVGYIIVGLLLLPFRAVKWLASHKLFFIGALVLAVTIFGFSYYNSHTQSTTAKVPVYQQTAPQTPYIGYSPSRLYYINTYKSDGDYVILSDFYTYDKKWQRQTVPIPVKANLIKIVKR